MIDQESRIMAKQLELMNRHLAKEKRDLKSLLNEDSPKIFLRDGSTHSIRKEELKKISEILPLENHGSLFLPVYIELSSGKYGKGTARISGKLECKLVARVLTKEIPEEKDELFVYKPELGKLRKELPTTTQYMFSL